MFFVGFYEGDQTVGIEKCLCIFRQHQRQQVQFCACGRGMFNLAW